MNSAWLPPPRAKQNFQSPAAARWTRNYAPSFRNLAGPAAAPGTPLPDFMVDDVLGCREGYVPEDFDHDQGVNRIFNLRTAPISAAIVIDIDLP